jgi:hypothetical protein
LTALLLLVAGAVGATPRSDDPPDRTYPIDLSLRRGDSPETARGPVTLRLDNLNRLRYKVIIGQQVTLLDGPDLSIAGFIPDLAAAPAAVVAAAAPAPPGDVAEALAAAAHDAGPPCPPADIPDFTGRLAEIQECLKAERLQVEAMLAGAARARTTLNDRRTSVLRLIGESDQVLLATNGAELLAAQVREERRAILRDLDDAAYDFPDPGQVADHRVVLESLIAALADLPRADPNTAWATWIGETDNYLRYSETREAAAKLLSRLHQLSPDSDFVAAVEELESDLAAWERDLAGLEDPLAYQVLIPVRCGYPYFQEKRTDFNLTLIDRTIADPTKNKTIEKIVTVVCPSNVTVSAGVAAAEISERDFGFVSSTPDEPAPADAPALVNRIALLNESDEQINPAVLISTRLWELWGGAYGLHLTTGAVADYDNPDGGLRFGYLLGVSVSIKDQLLVTAGIQGSRVPALAGGFELDDVQPAGLDAVPVTKDWQFGWTLGLTYGIGGGN